MKQKICIIGAGEIGYAIGQILKNQTNEILFWDKDSSKVPAQKPLSRTVPSADFLFLCVPSWTVREVMAGVTPFLSKKAVVVSLAKGIEQTTNKSMDELLEEFVPCGRIVILGGAMLAKELQQGLGGVGAVGARSQKVCRKLTRLFGGTDLCIECISDTRGVALAGVLKNIYAVGLGIADGLGWGNNKKGWLVAQAVKEMALIIKALGGKKESAYSAAGLGDLIATGYSPYSRNRRVGEELVKTGTCCLESEGSRALPIFVSAARRQGLSLPLLAVLETIFVKNQDVKTSFEKLFKEGWR
jgi:glycerol-3-phosphate dehydrogenase (NAD(P)+)